MFPLMIQLEPDPLGSDVGDGLIADDGNELTSELISDDSVPIEAGPLYDMGFSPEPVYEIFYEPEMKISNVHDERNDLLEEGANADVFIFNDTISDFKVAGRADDAIHVYVSDILSQYDVFDLAVLDGGELFFNSEDEASLTLNNADIDDIALMNIDFGSLDIA